MANKHILVIGSRSLKPRITVYVKALIEAGYEAKSVFDVIKGKRTELSIKSAINEAMFGWMEEELAEVHVVWDGYSVGTCGDICAALALGCKVLIIEAPAYYNPGHKIDVELVEELRKRSAKARRYLPQIEQAGLEVQG